MKSLVLFFGPLLLSATAQEATVGLNAELIYNENAPDKQGPAVVIDVIDGTPAAKAGIRNGDLIVGLNGADVAGKTAVESLHSSLVGPPGGQIKLTIFRVSEGRQFDANLTRVAYPLRRNPPTDPFEFSFPANWRPEVDAFPLPWSLRQDSTTSPRPLTIPTRSSGGSRANRNSLRNAFMPISSPITLVVNC